MEKESTTSPEQALRIVFFGSQDNLNYRFAKWSHGLGHYVELFSFDLDLGRSQPELLDPDLRGNYPSWFHVHSSPVRHFPRIPRDLKRYIETEFDLMVVSGTRGLLASRSVRLPKVLHAIGGEVAEAPFPFAGRWQGIPAAIYRSLRWPYAREALRGMNAIIENYHFNIRCLERLDLIDRRVALPMAEDVHANRQMVNKTLRQEKTIQYAQYRRVFLWLTRLNFRDPCDAAYKGADRFLQALNVVRSEIEAGSVRMIIGTHGHDVEAFRAWAEREGYSDYIDWIPHLSYPEMLTYLALPNAVLFGKFGEDLSILSGIDRDALSIGTVTVTTCDPDYICQIYGARPPYLNAVSTADIEARMRETMDMVDEQFDGLQQAMRSFGDNYLDYSAVMPRYISLLRSVLMGSACKPIDSGTT